eukprot:GFKZ01009989.1.p1 GENE.GFKZ01009989.1~~GFKZ01009989.1.p1  ORF type:complete len:148 (+),score=20.18 GFKZ01009989.1:438-881(+)
MAFVTPITKAAPLRPINPSSFCAARPHLSSITPRSRPILRMGLGEDGLKEDLDFAQNCIDEGCSVDAVQDVLTRLERRRAVLAFELTKIEDVMGVLARENLGGDRNLVAQAMEAAISIFSKTNDDYPAVGDVTNAWTLDPLKEQPKY